MSACAALPFIIMFYGAPSQYLQEDDSGTVLSIDQGEGGGARGRDDAFAGWGTWYI